MIEKLIETALSQFVILIVGGVAATLTMQIQQLKTDKKEKAEIEAKERRLQNEVNKWILQAELLRQINYHMDTGFISNESLAKLEEGFKIYEAYGGNGVVALHMGDVRKLSRKED